MLVEYYIIYAEPRYLFQSFVGSESFFDDIYIYVSSMAIASKFHVPAALLWSIGLCMCHATINVDIKEVIHMNNHHNDRMMTGDTLDFVVVSVERWDDWSGKKIFDNNMKKG